MSDLISSDNPINDGQEATLRRIVGMIIPASEQYGVPGADDEQIFRDILVTARDHADLLKTAVADLDDLAQRRHDDSFRALDAADQVTLVDDFRAANAGFARTLASITAQCYYRDDRVMQSLGMEARPPFPQGYEVPEGDWSMLDPVRARGSIYKKVE